MDTIKIKKDHTRIICDGGCSLNEPDNTYSAFLSAANRSYHAIKCDIRFTKDRHCITSRYRDLTKLTGKKIHVSQTDYQDILNLPLKDPTYTYIPELITFLNICIKYKKKAYIEIKPPIGYLEIKQIMEIITSTRSEKHCKIISDDFKFLKMFREHSLEIGLEIRSDKYSDELLFDANKYHADIYLPIKELSKDLIDMIHEYRLKIGSGKVNNPIQARLLIEMGIDFLYTNSLEGSNY